MPESPYIHDFSTTKFLVMLEIEPMTDKYQEIMLTPEQANKVRDVVQSFSPTRPDGSFFLTCTEEDALIPFGQGEYSEEDIKEAQQIIRKNHGADETPGGILN